MSDKKRKHVNENNYQSNGFNHNNKRKNKKRRSSSASSSRSASSKINDEIGHYIGQPGDTLDERYVIVREMGKGTFGKVYKCKDNKYNDHVAIKVVRSVKRYSESAKIEADILDDIYDKQKSYNNTDYCVNLYSKFKFNGHFCFVFETLGISLYDIIKRNDYKGLPLECVRSISKQLLEAVLFLRTINLIHTDLKLENILFYHKSLQKETIKRNGKNHSIFTPVNSRIKLIDFGGATYDDDPQKSSVINTRQYRGPEVILELGWSFPSDIWSVGCIIPEILSGELLFQTHDELEHLALIERCKGQFPKHMCQDARHGRKYFHPDGTVKTEELSKSSYKFWKKSKNVK
eukprot:gene10722-14398_t